MSHVLQRNLPFTTLAVAHIWLMTVRSRVYGGLLQKPRAGCTWAGAERGEGVRKGVLGTQLLLLLLFLNLFCILTDLAFRDLSVREMELKGTLGEFL